MGRPKKKLPIAEAKEPTPGDNPPVQRKRGRPRKVVPGTVKVEDAQSADSKKLKTSGETTEASSNHNANQSEATIVEENGIAAKVSLNEESSKSSAVKREGNRRKSEPRRAAESSFIAGR